MAWKMPTFAKGKRQAVAHRYPLFLFHFVGFVQFISSAAVVGVMFLFLHHLREKSFAVPWMFFFVSSAQSASKPSLTPLAASIRSSCLSDLARRLSAAAMLPQAVAHCQ